MRGPHAHRDAAAHSRHGPDGGARRRRAQGPTNRPRGALPSRRLPADGRAGPSGGQRAPELGGAVPGAVAYALAMMEISAACASTSVGMAVTNMCAELIATFGTEAQKQKYVTRARHRRGRGRGLRAVRAARRLRPRRRAHHRGEDRASGWVLNGTKQWITSGAYAGVIVVWARTSKTATRASRASSSRRARPASSSASPEDKMGLRGSNTVPLIFEDVRRLVAGAPAGAGGRRLQAGDDRRSTAAASASPRRPAGWAGRRSRRRVSTPKDRQAFGHADRRLPGAALHAGRHADAAATRPSC